MSSQPRTESQGSKSRHAASTPRRAAPTSAPTPRPPTPEDDALDVSSPPSDDTPTIISRQTPAPPTSPGQPDAEANTSIRGRRLAHFELIEPIGVGGMAAVLRARDTQLDRFVALKILPPEMAIDDENVKRFHQEARSAAKLDHENIARVFFCREDQRLHFIAFEFVEGENLRTILDQRGRVPVGEALHYMVQVAAGLAHASQRGVVHRDIKPSNIIVTPNGRAKLVDMGLARCESVRSDDDLTQSGVTLGTFDYISPEQALEPRDADVRSDIYSLGCTFYHMLTGRPPVPEGTAAKKLHCHQHVKPPDPRQFVPDLPTEVVLILDRMMAKQPRDRFQSPEQLVNQLLLTARHLGVSPEVPEGVLMVEGTVPNPPVSRPLLWAALALAAVVGLVFLLDSSDNGAQLALSGQHDHCRARRPGRWGEEGQQPCRQADRESQSGSCCRSWDRNGRVHVSGGGGRWASGRMAEGPRRFEPNRAAPGRRSRPLDRGKRSRLAARRETEGDDQVEGPQRASDPADSVIECANHASGQAPGGRGWKSTLGSPPSRTCVSSSRATRAA